MEELTKGSYHNEKPNNTGSCPSSSSCVINNTFLSNELIPDLVLSIVP